MNNNLTSQIVQDIHNTHIIVGIIQIISTFNLIIKRQVDLMSSSNTATVTSLWMKRCQGQRNNVVTLIF